MAISILAIIALFVFLRKVMDRPEKKKKEAASAKAPRGSMFPAGAFEFDDAIEGDHWVNPGKLAKEKKQAKAESAAKPAEPEEKTEGEEEQA